MRRRQVRLLHTIADDVREVMADRILIEQVLVNLLKNAAEAIDNAHMPVERREVQLDVGNARGVKRTVRSRNAPAHRASSVA